MTQQHWVGEQWLISLFLCVCRFCFFVCEFCLEFGDNWILGDTSLTSTTLIPCTMFVFIFNSFFGEKFGQKKTIHCEVIGISRDMSTHNWLSVLVAPCVNWTNNNEFFFFLAHVHARTGSTAISIRISVPRRRRRRTKWAKLSSSLSF